MPGKWTWGVAAFLLAGTANAADQPLFEKGKVVIDVLGADIPFGSSPTYRGYIGPVTLYSEHAESSNGARDTATWSVYGVEPSLDYFITDHLSIGGRAAFLWQESHTYDSAIAFAPLHENLHGFDIAVTPRVGYAIPFTSTFGFWPRVSGGVVAARQWRSGGSKTSTVGEYVEGNFAAVARLAPHVMLELGPTLAYSSLPSADVSMTQLELAARSSFRVDF